MIDFYTAATANGRKIAIMLEECGLDYKTHAINLAKAEQKKPEFLKINPNGRIPAIVDHAPSMIWGGETTKLPPLAVFESGAILIYLAEKSGKFYHTTDIAARAQLMAWLMWQMSGLGPMAGQYYYFTKVAPEDMPLAKKRYLDELERLLGVMDARLAEVPYLAGSDYTIADIACFPGVAWVGNLGISIDKYPHVKAWHDKIAVRPAVIKAMKSPEA